MKKLWIAAAGVVALACGGTSDPTPPTCAAGEVKVVGTVDNTAEAHTISGSSSVFANAINGEDGELIVNTSSGGSEHAVVSLKFHKLVANGAQTSARGFVDLSLQSGPNVGNCDTGEEVSTLSMDADGNGGTFVLRSLHDSPYCSGAERSGSLAGCFKFAQ